MAPNRRELVQALLLLSYPFSPIIMNQDTNQDIDNNCKAANRTRLTPEFISFREFPINEGQHYQPDNYKDC